MRLRFRTVEGEPWFNAVTVNISASGVLFQTSDPAPAQGAVLEMALELSALGPRIADITCSGRVVRTGTAAEPGTTLAATIERYSFARGAK